MVPNGTPASNLESKLNMHNRAGKAEATLVVL
jgi:hypothetical protein